MNKWDLLLPATKRLLIALILLDHYQYIPKLISHLNVLLYHKKMNSKIWKMHVDDPACFNEEPGELSFAALGRAKGSDSSTDIFEHLRSLYPLVNCCIEQHDPVETDESFSSSKGRKQSDRFRVKADSDDTLAVFSFFMTAIREMKNNMFMVYDGTAESYKSKIHANAHRVQSASSLLWRTDDQFIEMLRTCMKKTKKQTIGCNIISNTEGISWLDDDDIEDCVNEYQEPANIIDPDEYSQLVMDRSIGVISEGHENLSQISSFTSQTQHSIMSRIASESSISLAPRSEFDLDEDMYVHSFPDDIPDPFDIHMNNIASEVMSIHESKHDTSVSSMSSNSIQVSSVRSQHDDIKSQVSAHSMAVPELILEQKINKDKLKMFKIKWQNQALSKASWEYADFYEKWDDYKYLIQDWRENMGPKLARSNRYKRRKTK